MLRIFTLTLALALVVTLIVSPVALAQDTTGAAQNASARRLFDHFVVRGGVITWFILIPLSIATIALIIEHSLSIRPRTILPWQVVERVRSDLEAKRYLDAVRFTADHPSVLCATVHAGLVQASFGYGAMQRAVADTLDHHAGRLMRKIEYLNVIGNVSPMIGLFGTVYGMIGLFASITEAGGIPEPARIADDISIALVTTFWGLLVAIPALSVFAFFRNRIDELMAECSSTAERLLSTFEPSHAAAATLPVEASATPVSPPASIPAGLATQTGMDG